MTTILSGGAKSRLSGKSIFHAANIAKYQAQSTVLWLFISDPLFGMMRLMKWLLLILLTLISATAMAEGDRDPRRAIRGAVIQGEDGTVVGSYICRNFHILEGTSFVGCGAASDLFSVVPQSAELSHYRVEHTLHLLQGPLEMRVSFGWGMAEGQLGQDAPGFFLNPDASQQSIEAAGPEAAMALDLWWPTAFRDSDFRLRFDAGVTWLPGWQEVGGTSNDVVPFGILTVNAEF